MAEFNNLLDQQKVLQRQDLTPTEKLVAIVLLSFRNAETGRCNPPIVSKNKEKETVCTRTGFSDVCVQKAIRSLESKKVFQVTRELGMPSFFIFRGTNEVSTGTNVVSTGTNVIAPNVVSKGANLVSKGTNEVREGVLTSLVHNKELTNKEQINNKEEKESDSFSLTPIEKTPRRQPLKKPENVTQQTWDDFNAIRKAKKAPLTETALIRIQNEATKAGIDLETALQVCCERGWQGFKAEWYLKDRQNKPAQRTLAQNNEPTPEDFTDKQINMFAYRISREKPYSVLSPGYCESYDQLQRRIESNLRHPENFKKFIPVLRELHLI